MSAEPLCSPVPGDLAGAHGAAVADLAEGRAGSAWLAGVACTAFLQLLHPEGYRYMAAFREGTTEKVTNLRHDDLSAVGQFAQQSGDRHVYFGVAPRIDAVGHGTNHCAALHALFVDIDFKVQSETATRARVAAFRLQPSAVVHSGGGLHVYWFLREPFNLPNGAAPYARAVLRALATAVGGDLASAEPARILRLPGTRNYKYTPPRQVVLESIVRERRYALAEFLDVLPVVPVPALERPRKPVEHGLTVEARIQAARQWLANQPPAIEGQGGDARTFKVCAAVVVGHDVPAENAIQVLAEWNARCVPPWDEYELRKKVSNAGLYATGQRGAQLQTRRLVVTWADAIKPRPVLWFWQDRLPLGMLSLIGGREGIGKTTVAYTLAADVTRGRLPGKCFGKSRTVIVAATEDSWEHTIVPRLTAAGADLTKVARVNVESQKIGRLELSFPDDITALEQLIAEYDTALVLLDPVISRLSRKIDTHKDSDVRSALEPLARLADATGASVVGIIHVNKGSSRDPLNMIMGSRAFVAVARAVLFVAQDPEDEKVRLLGQPKNNLGRADLPTLTFEIDSATVGQTDEGPIVTGKLRWTGESERTIRDVVEQSAEGGDRTAIADAKDWLNDFLTAAGGYAPSNDIKKEGRKAGHSASTLKRAHARLKLTTKSFGFPRRTNWCQANAVVPEQMDLEKSEM